MSPVWLDTSEVEAIQEQILYEGERPGYLHSPGVLHSALVRVQNHWAYNYVSDLHQLAALYCIAIAKCHAFQNGNKRAATVSAAYFLEKNGIIFDPDDASPDGAEMIKKATVDEIDYVALGHWIEVNSESTPECR